MNSCANTLTFGSCGSAMGIDPTMQIINSLGLPQKSTSGGGYSSANYYSSTKPSVLSSSLALDKFPTSSNKSSAYSFLESMKYDTLFNQKTYVPKGTYSMTSSSGIKQTYVDPDPMGYNIAHSYTNTNESKKKPSKAGATCSKAGDPDENNNFLRDQHGRCSPCCSCQNDPSDRICQLAQPKRLPCEYQDDRSVYWTSKRVRPNCGNHTHFETTARLDELAMPKTITQECDCHMVSHCNTTCGYCGCCSCQCMCNAPPCSDRDPRSVDWNRLATPKTKYPPNHKPLIHVKKSALRAEPTKRLCKLSAPKPVIDVAKFYLWLWKKQPDSQVKLTKVERLFIGKCHMAEMRVMIRCDLDPSNGGDKIEAKMAAVVPTIKHALNKGAKSVSIVSNRRPTPGTNADRLKEFSLKPYVEPFEKLLGVPILFLDDCVGYQARALCQDPDVGTVFLLENLAFHPEEMGSGVDDQGKEFVCPKEKIQAFQSSLFQHVDTYVIDTFRELTLMTSTTIGYKDQEKAYGYKVKSELDYYNKVISKPPLPMVAIIGGTIKETYDIIQNLMGIATDIVVGGETALAFLKALKRIDLGVCSITPKMERKALNLHARAKDTKTGLLLPSDLVVRNVNTGQFYSVLTREDVDDDYEIVDIGPFTRKCYVKVIEKATTLLWWGLMGTLLDGTNAIAAAFVAAAQNGARTYVADNITQVNVVNNACVGIPTHVTEDAVTTTMLLRGKLPKGLAVLNPARKKIKKREAAAPPVSKKPTRYDMPGMQIASGDKIMCISDIDLEGKNVLLRVDFNVPMQGQKVINNYGIRMVVPTIKYALKWKARTVVIVGHRGNPQGKKEDQLTMKPICDELASLLGHTVVFVPETVGKQPEAAIANAHPGTVIMLENIRFYLEETGSGTTKAGLRWKTTKAEATPQTIAAFCEKYSKLGDVFVNDAFPCLHLDHSSIMSYYPPIRVCGFLVKNELKYMAKICNNPRRRFVVILGGNNFKQKMSLMWEIMKEADDILLVGALGVAFLKVYLNMQIGGSFFDPATEPEIKSIIELSDYYSCRLFYPVDFVVATNKNGENKKQMSITEKIADNQMVIDIGDLSSSMFGRIISKSKMLLWVGVAGITEVEAGSKGSEMIMNAIVSATKDPEKNLISIIGGRSTCEFTEKFKAAHDSFTHITTGSETAFKLITERQLLAVDTLLPKPDKRPIRVLSCDLVDLADKRVLLRADLSISFTDGILDDDFPLTPLASTIKTILKRGARSVVIIGTRGNPEGKVDELWSLRPLVEPLQTLIEQEIFFVEEGVSEAAEQASKTQKVVLVENIKFHPEEEGVKDGPNHHRLHVSYQDLDAFRAMLTSLGDIFVNESLSSLSQNYSSVVGLGNIRKVAGPALKKTVQKLEEVNKNMERPLVAILGGALALDDVTYLYQQLDLVDEVILCGNLALTILKSEGAHVGNFEMNPVTAKLIPRILSKAKSNKVNLHLPVDFVAGENPAEKIPGTSLEKAGAEEGEEMIPEEKQPLYTVSQGVPEDLLVLDLGPETIEAYTQVISQARTIIFQGLVSPYYMYEGYDTGTRAIFEAIHKSVANGSKAVALGMKAMSCLNKMEALETFHVYSTGVTVFYDMLRGKPLSGLNVLETTPPKALKKLSIEQMDLTNLRVLIRLDLNVPTVEDVVLDIDKLEEAAPTIQYALKNGAKCVILLGHRGNPAGYKNRYLSMKPLLVDLNQILETTVTLIERPCSKKAKKMLSDPEPGSVFLMENLKFYSAEYGVEVVQPPPEAPPEQEEQAEKKVDQEISDAPEVTEASPVVAEEDTKENAEEGKEKQEEEEKEEESSVSEPSRETVSDGEGGKNIDSFMFQPMTPKTIAQFVEDIAACGDVFINDDITDIAEELTSFNGFGFEQRGCGLLLANYLTDLDDPDTYNLPGVAPLSPAPPK